MEDSEGKRKRLRLVAESGRLLWATLGSRPQFVLVLRVWVKSDANVSCAFPEVARPY